MHFILNLSNTLNGKKHSDCQVCFLTVGMVVQAVKRLDIQLFKRNLSPYGIQVGRAVIRLQDVAASRGQVSYRR